MNNKKREYPDGLKLCKSCGELILLENYSFNKTGRPVQPCKPCRAEKMRLKRKENPEWRKEHDKKSRNRYHQLQKENGISLEGEKFCNDCKKLFPKIEFHYARGTSSGLSSYCKICASVRASKYRKSPFEFSRAEYDKFFKIQNGVCGICDKPAKNKRLDTDHNHKTGEVRGLLCGPHNMMLETMGENIEWIYKMADWIINNGVRNKIYTKGGELIDKTS